MKKILFYLILALSFLSFASSGTVKKEKYKPEGKQLFVFNEYDSSAVNSNEYGGLYSSPRIDALEKIPYKKYKGMEGYVDKEVTKDHDVYQKVILKNGDVFYHFNFKSYDQVESVKNYEKRLNEIDKLKKIKFPNIDDLFVAKVVTEPRNVYIVTFSNGLKLYNVQLDGLLRLSRKITNSDDLRLLIDTINTDKIYFSYDLIDNLAKIELKSDSLKMDVFIHKENLYVTIVSVIFSSWDWIFVNNFKIFQNGNIYEAPSDLIFQQSGGSTVYEWSEFILNNKFISYVRSLDDSNDAQIRFYGSRQNADDTIEAKTITNMKKILSLNDMLAKYFKLAIDEPSMQ